MTSGYRMKSLGSGFQATQTGGGTVGVYKSELEARQGMADCLRDDLMLKVAKSLVKQAVSSLMHRHHITRQAAHEWIREAVG
jgi:hypothetical protein